MAKGTTESGFEFEINDKLGEDYELLELIVELDESPLVTPKLLNKMLGVDQVKALKNHIRDDEGFVNTRKLTEEMKSIFETIIALKK